MTFTNFCELPFKLQVDTHSHSSHIDGGELLVVQKIATTKEAEEVCLRKPHWKINPCR